MPTGNIVSKLWFIRVTVRWLEFKTRYELESLSFIDHVRLLAVSHLGQKTEKEHVHLLVELSNPLQKQTVDKRYKRVFAVSGADYSSKQWDGDMGAGAGSYLFHDPLAEIFINKGFTDEQIETFRKLNADVQKVVEINKQRASGRCVERILKQINESDREWTRNEIALQLLTDIKDGVMYEPGDYVLRRYIEEIYAKQLKGTQWEKYASLRVSNLVRLDDVEICYPM